MTLTAIVAMTANRVIGKDGTLPWHLPEDLKVFRKITTGHPIVMGRKTWDSIGKPLPKRQNIVLTRDTDWSAEGAEVIHSPEGLEGIDLINPDVMIIGGAQVYDIFLDRLNTLYVSHVYEDYMGDTYFPDFSHLFGKMEVLEQFDTFELRKYAR